MNMENTVSGNVRYIKNCSDGTLINVIIDKENSKRVKTGRVILIFE